MNEEERNTKNEEKKIVGVGGEKRGRIFFERFRIDLV